MSIIWVSSYYVRIPLQFWSGVILLNDFIDPIPKIGDNKSSSDVQYIQRWLIDAMSGIQSVLGITC
jgi:hypothetical protein